MKFSQKEIKDLFFAWIMISLAFTILFSGISTLFNNPSFFILSFLISGFTAGIGFLLHELMHKYVAQNYGLKAEFVAFYNMLFLAIGFSFFGFILAAPGAVMMQGRRITKEQNGKISLAGPMTNIVLGLGFLIPLIFLKPEGILRIFLDYGLIINALLALFNLIPLGPFDGKKIWEWNKTIHIITVLIALGLFLSKWVLF